MLSSRICLDASMIVRLIVDKEDERILEHLQEWSKKGYRFAAPNLIYYEVTNALYQYQRHETLSIEAII